MLSSISFFSCLVHNNFTSVQAILNHQYCYMSSHQQPKERTTTEISLTYTMTYSTGVGNSQAGQPLDNSWTFEDASPEVPSFHGYACPLCGHGITSGQISVASPDLHGMSISPLSSSDSQQETLDVHTDSDAQFSFPQATLQSTETTWSRTIKGPNPRSIFPEHERDALNHPVFEHDVPASSNTMMSAHPRSIENSGVSGPDLLSEGFLKQMGQWHGSPPSGRSQIFPQCLCFHLVASEGLADVDGSLSDYASNTNANVFNEMRSHVPFNPTATSEPMQNRVEPSSNLYVCNVPGCERRFLARHKYK